MQLSPLQLERYHFNLGYVRARADHEASHDGDTESVIGVEMSEQLSWSDVESQDGKSYAPLKLYIALENKGEKKAPYDIAVEVEGVFQISPAFMKKEGWEEVFIINGASMLYTVIREYVLSFTSRAVSGPLMLPTMNFLDYVKKIPEAKEKAKALQEAEAKDAIAGGDIAP
ncbi:protein-export chaperone SecB [Chromobacterium haemolyticum]|uniref:protein-export chaperone SecB n=1 Tax=Chromobacterium haemolyticum TaxID=394935 RepID=UPI001745D019|nr:protein-export chaperone SecB [Chromobacterium haemolyticum]QOD81639.1 protein-export chaperone SecB [Chromobacterium haemolyticum]